MNLKLQNYPLRQFQKPKFLKILYSRSFQNPAILLANRT